MQLVTFLLPWAEPAINCAAAFIILSKITCPLAHVLLYSTQ